jgi:two-component system LytT family sensor kinase
MTLNPIGSRGTTVSPRIALISIFAFWLVYFAVATIRSLILGYGHQVEMLAARGFVSIGSMVATFIVYQAMRPLASRSLAINITAIALLAIPAAIAYSSMNLTAFKRIDHRLLLEKEVAKAKVVIRSAEDAERLRDQAQALRDAAQQIKDQAREAIESSRERAEEAAEAARQSARDAREAVREAAREAQRHGVKLDTDAMIARMATPPEPPQPPQLTAPAMMIQVGQPSVTDHEMDLSIAAQIADQALNGYFFFIAWGALFLALSYAAAVRVAEREAASYRAAARDAELRALRYQVNPHFLFNTLNSLSTLILKDSRDEAEKMILNLATFFRTSLTADPTEDVLLAEEIRLQRLYLDIEAVRFPERLIVNMTIPPSLLTACVPCLILQPLVENAIKYGVSRSRRPVTVSISAREDSHGLVLTVEDDGDPLEDGEAARGTGVGLKNVTNRLRARFGEDATCRYGALANGGFGVTLFMPLLRHGC